MPTKEDLKQKYRDLIKLYHPDLHPQDTLSSTMMMQRLNCAYETISAGLQRHDHTSLIFLRTAARRGDDAVRGAVAAGCLYRMRNNRAAALFGHRVRWARDTLQDQAGEIPPALSFFLLLFSQFLKVIEAGQARPLPFTWNSTKFYRNLKVANRFLDLGIRSFFHYRAKDRLKIFRNIPISYLDDAEKAFCFLKGYVRDAPHRRIIQDRLQLIVLFSTRMTRIDRLAV